MMYSQKLQLDQEFDLRHPVAKGEMKALLLELKGRQHLYDSDVKALHHLLEDMQAERETVVKRDRVTAAFKKMQSEVRKSLQEECSPGVFAILTDRLDLIYSDMLLALATDDSGPEFDLCGDDKESEK